MLIRPFLVLLLFDLRDHAPHIEFKPTKIGKSCFNGAKL